MDLQRLDTILAELGEPAFRARQVWAWTARGAESFEQMTDLPAALRSQLAERLGFSCLQMKTEATARDGTVKALFETADGRAVEAVLMRYSGRQGSSHAASPRRSICVSSQSGCPLTCRFCATGAMKFARNLTASEILEQALHFRRVEAIDHCVFMGMGEPMLNLDAVLGACERLPEIGVTHRRTTISTVGWIPGIERLADCDMPVRLALSLHAAEESLRSELMPVNERYPLRDVIEACRSFHARRRRRVFVEYVMLAGINDRYEQALALASLLTEAAHQEKPVFKVNLIPFNPSGSEFQGSGRDSIAAFRAALESRGVPVTVRLTRGRDIDAACGQLAARAAA
ncbi:MAG TPA: 23S rRNA (adenine(2503)-C(2))-methyltransferase RlmN [Solirubrobacteraceae bacterium]